MDDMRVLNNVKGIRIDKGLSVRDLARLSGVGIATISNIENGVSSPNHYTILKLSKALGMDVIEVFDMNWRNKPYL